MLLCRVIYAECHYAECRCAQCRGAVVNTVPRAYQYKIVACAKRFFSYKHSSLSTRSVSDEDKMLYTFATRMASVSNRLAPDSTWAQCYKTFYDRNLRIFVIKQRFVLAKPFQPSLMFVRKAD